MFYVRRLKGTPSFQTVSWKHGELRSEYMSLVTFPIHQVAGGAKLRWAV